MSTRSFAALAALGLTLVACGRGSVPQGTSATQTEDEKTFYAMGQTMGRAISGWQLTPAELESLKKGIVDGVAAQVDFDTTTWEPKIQALAQGRMTRAAQALKAKGQAFLDKAAQESGAVKTASGLVYRTLKPGSGASPSDSNTVKVHFEGKLADGHVFDSSLKRGQPITFTVGQVLPCWREGVQRMKVGERAQTACPSDLAYGDRGRPPVPGGAAVSFEFELLEIVK